MSGNEGGVTAAGGAGGTGEDGIGLSRTSALNNRYFEDKAKSRSLDNLLEGPPDMQVCGDSFLSLCLLLNLVDSFGSVLCPFIQRFVWPSSGCFCS